MKKENKLAKEIYERFKFEKTFILLAALVFFLGFFSHFHISLNPKKALISSIREASQCDFSFKDFSFTFFFPGIEIEKLSIPSRCIQQSKGLFFNKVNLGFAGFAFSPLGIKLNGEIAFLDSLIDIDYVQALKKSEIRFGKQTKVEFSNLAELASLPLSISGHVNLNGRLQLSQGKLSKMNMKIESQNFNINSQNVMGFSVPQLDIGLVGANLRMLSPGKLQIDSLAVGQDNSPVKALASGEFGLNQSNPRYSSLNIDAKVSFSADFLQQFSILNMFLASIKKEGPSYLFKITGTVARPKFNSQ